MTPDQCPHECEPGACQCELEAWQERLTRRSERHPEHYAIIAVVVLAFVLAGVALFA